MVWGQKSVGGKSSGEAIQIGETVSAFRYGRFSETPFRSVFLSPSLSF